MLHIKYKLEKSKNHGIGLFADEDLKKGQLIYTASPVLDMNITNDQFDALEDAEKREVRYWGFPVPDKGVWHVDFDVSKFINHSYEPTVSQDPKKTNAYLLATRDVQKGEELTQNYLEFESKDDLQKRGIETL